MLKATFVVNAQSIRSTQAEFPGSYWELLTAEMLISAMP